MKPTYGNRFARTLKGCLACGITSAALGWCAQAADLVTLWEVGKEDNNNREFALAPNKYGEYQEDGFFAVGRSDAKRDWPYVHPGPYDMWGGGRPHTFYIAFGLNRVPGEGECKLVVDFLDTHSRSAPEMKVEINGHPFKRALPFGAGDDSVYGQPAKGKEFRWEIPFPSSLLRKGHNAVAITGLTGSWVLYDAVTLQTPPGAELGEAHGTVASTPMSPPVLIEREGRLCQAIEFSIRHAGEPTTAEVKVDGRKVQTVALQAGSHTVTVPVPAVEKPGKVNVEVESGGTMLAQAAVALKPVRKWVVYLLPHSHVDIGYTHVQTDVEHAQWKYLEMAMEAARRTASYPEGARFKWNVEVLWAVDSYLKQATPEKRRQFIDAVKAGQVGLQALYGNQLTGLCRPEELLRLMSCAHEVGGLCGTKVESAMITDVPGYTWGMVPAMAHNGVKYFSIGPNGGDRIGHTIAAWGDKPFWWVGPNGRDKVLVWMTGTGYYQVYSSPRRLMDYLGQLEDKKYPYDFVQVRHCLGDNGAPDVNFADKVKAWNDTHAYPKLVIATSDEMFRDFEKRYGSEIPVAKGDFTPYWEDGAASSARETALNRAAADRLVQAEAIYALYNPAAYPAEEFTRAWREVLLYDEHTWGAHNSISQPDAPFVKSQWAIKQAFALNADKESRRLLDAACASRGDLEPAPSDKAFPIDVIDTTGSPTPYALVTIPKKLSLTGDCVKTHPTNEWSLPSQRLASGELVFRANWNAFNQRRFYVCNGPASTNSDKGARVEGTVLKTPEITVSIHPQSGAIQSIRALDGTELVDASAFSGLNEYFYLPGSDVKGVRRAGTAKVTVRERGPLVASVLIESEAPGCRGLTREVRVHAMRSYVEIIDTVDKEPIRAKEGVHFGFGFNVPKGVVRMDVPWSVVEVEKDQIPGACKNWFTVQRWVDVSNDKYGVAWFTPDAPLVEVGGLTANLIGSLSDPRAWMNRVEPSQTIYSWAMNNHWHTNYRAEQEGPTVFRYFIFPHKGPFKAEQNARIGTELSQPLVVTPARGRKLEHKFYGLESPIVESAGDKVQLTILKPSNDRQAIIMRFYNPSDSTQSLKPHWKKSAPKNIWLSDGSERPLAKWNGSAEMRPHDIVTLRVSLPDADGRGK